MERPRLDHGQLRNRVRQVSVRFADRMMTDRYLLGLLFPAFLVAILVGLIAGLGAWWLWPLAAAFGLPALIVVLSPHPERRREEERWHLR